MTRDWKDLIPASGEAHAQIGLKGRFGGKSNMRRFKRFGGGRRNSKFASYRTRRSNKWWFTYIGQDGDGETPIVWEEAADGFNVPYVAFSLEGHNVSGSDNARGSNEQVIRWIGRQGGISVTLRYDEDTASVPVQYTNQKMPLVTMAYAWFKFKQDFAQTLPNNITAQFGMQTSQNLGLILQRKDIIRWGYFDVVRQFNRQAVFNGSLASPGQEFENSLAHSKTRSFVPFPNFPKAGFSILPNDILMCLLQPVEPTGYDSITTSHMSGARIVAMPSMRLLMAD